MTTDNDRFERDAAEFSEATGMLAPGKDQAAAQMDSPTYDVRAAAWNAYWKGKAVGITAATLKARVEIDDEIFKIQMRLIGSRNAAQQGGRDSVASHRQSDIETCQEIRKMIQELK